MTLSERALQIAADADRLSVADSSGARLNSIVTRLRDLARDLAAIEQQGVS